MRRSDESWFHPEFETDLISAARYLNLQRQGPGAEFLDDAERAIEEIMSDPARWPERQGGVRRFLLTRFPYLVRYRVATDTVQLLSILHGARHPSTGIDR